MNELIVDKRLNEQNDVLQLTNFKLILSCTVEKII